MLNKKDKKNIILIIVALILILVVFILIRGCNHSDVEENNPNNQEPPVVNPDDHPVEGDSSIPKEDNTSQTVVSQQTSQEEVPEVEELYPEIDLDITDYVVSFGEDFELPKLDEFDQNGNPLLITMSYQFRAIDSIEFIPVLDFSTDRIGTYIITYYVENIKHYISEIDIYVDVVDDSSPVILGMVPEVDEYGNVVDYTPISSGSFINHSLVFQFEDNDEIFFAEYYNAKLDNTIPGDTMEQEAMPTVVPIEDITNFTLSEEGEYHIRAYDRSGNCIEFIVTIDYTRPEVEMITYQQNSDHSILVTIAFNEAVLPVAGWELSEDQKVLTKIYYDEVDDEVMVTDLAGNELIESIWIQYEFPTDPDDQNGQNNLDNQEHQNDDDNQDTEDNGNHQDNEENVTIDVQVLQNDQVTNSRNLNRNDGAIKVYVDGQVEITYTLDDGEIVSYENGTELTEDGFYHFTITDGTNVVDLEFSISSMGITD